MIVGNKALASKTYLELQRNKLFKHLLIKEERGWRDKTGAAKKQQCSLGQGAGSDSRAVHSSVFELLCKTKAPNTWKMLTI